MFEVRYSLRGRNEPTAHRAFLGEGLLEWGVDVSRRPCHRNAAKPLKKADRAKAILSDSGIIRGILATLVMSP